jgi:serine/arginine repetitive matrix protein 1
MALSVDQKLLRATKFPPEFDKRVDIEKVNMELMRKWVAEKITNLLKNEDDIVVEMVYNLLEENRHVSELPARCGFCSSVSPKSKRYRSN